MVDKKKSTQINSMSERPRARTRRELMIDTLKVEQFNFLLEKFQKITGKMKHISPGDEEIGQKLLRKQAKKVQVQIELYLEYRAERGHELTDEMIAFEGLETVLSHLHFETVLKPQLPKFAKPDNYYPTTPEKKEFKKFHEPVGKVDRKSYSNHTLYILVEDMVDEWDRKKDTEEFSCYKGDRIRFFEWCAEKYRYKGGKGFDAEGMVNSLNSSRTRAKSKDEKDYQ